MKLVLNFITKITILLCLTGIYAQNVPKMVYKTDYYWQQQADYYMNIDMNIETNQYVGKQKIIYTNNSPDTLNKVFYHLYFNAFQPGSEMDIRSQTIEDPDRRIAPNIGTKEEPVYDYRLAKLKPNEIGFINVKSLFQDNIALDYFVEGTILEVELNKPIQPGEQVEFDMLFEGQVPLQIRRSGRNSDEGVALSMGQWYPKIAEYDKEGWHPNIYVSREFYGVWGNYDVKITIDKNYTIGGTGYLQNSEAIGHGYAKKTVATEGDKLTWHFVAPNVHDFAWAADSNYIHDVFEMVNGPTLHFFYKNNLEDTYLNNWKKIQPKTVALFNYFNTHIGRYPYKQYSLIQGGDGGMEYGMCTLMSAEKEYDRFLGTTAHEIAHSWFQFVLASNEFKHEWMDEGFTSYIEDEALNEINNLNKPNAQEIAYERYIKFANSGNEQPLTTHADRYASNKAYSRAAYSKGAVFLSQLRYVIGEDNVANTIKRYYLEFGFKHPKPEDFIRTAERISGIELDWYLTDFGQTTNTIDYAIKDINKKTITLERIGLMPMPIDIRITYKDDTTQDFYIPLSEMRGEKPTSATILKDWNWAFPTYTFKTDKKIKSANIDPSTFMADVNRKNNEL